MDSAELFELIELVCSKPIAEFELEREGLRIRIVHRPPSAVLAGTVSQPVAATVESVVAASPTEKQAAVEIDEDLHVINSPIVGTFFRSANPSAEPFVKIGDRIAKGTVVCIIEAMKLMNEIESEVSGVITDILVENGQPVEFDEPLFRVRPD